MKKTSTDYLPCLWVSVAISIMLFTPGLVIYLNNPAHFNASGSIVGGAYVSMVLLCTLPLTLLLAIPYKKWPETVVACGFALCCDVLLQYNVWSSYFVAYHPGSYWTWDFLFLAFMHCIFLLTPFVLAWFIRAFLNRNAGKLLMVIALAQLVLVGNALFSKTEAEEYDFKEYTFSETEKFTFGEKENIIVLVVDCMGEGICKEVLEKYPELKEALRDFVCFDRMISPLPWTMYAVPAMMTGVNFPRKEYRIPADDDHAAYLKQVCASETSLFMALKKKGFRVEGYPYLITTISYSPNVLDNSIPLDYSQQKKTIGKIGELLCNKLCPFFLASLLPFSDSQPFLTFEERVAVHHRECFDQVFYRRLQNEFCIGETPAVFKYLHLQGAHEGVNLDENLEWVRDGLKYRQLRGSLRNIESLIQKLKELDLYDNATILLVGDHSECYEMQNIAFVKRKHEHRKELAFNSIPCQVSDIAGTVLKEYGIQTDLPSLYDSPPIWSEGIVRPEQTRYADFPAWRICDNSLNDDNAVYCNCRIRVDGDAIVFENFIDDRRITLNTQVMLVLRKCDNGARWFSQLDYSQRFACLRACQGSLPDGKYSLELYFQGLSEDGNRITYRVDTSQKVCFTNGRITMET